MSEDRRRGASIQESYIRIHSLPGLRLFHLIVLLTFGWGSWSAKADSTVVFNEIMYHPSANEPQQEWVELHNQMAVNMDISSWSIQGGIQFTFPEGTIVPGRGYLIVAISPIHLTSERGITNVLGPFTGRLSNSGERLELRNNNNRLMDWIEYEAEDEWPVGADGGGVSLAKQRLNSASFVPENWKTSEQVGGTPGRENFPGRSTSVETVVLVQFETLWQYQSSGSNTVTDWKAASFPVLDWPSGQAPFYAGNAQMPSGGEESIDTLFNTGVDSRGELLLPGAEDPHYQLTASPEATSPTPPRPATVIENHPAWLANDAQSSWIGVQNPGTLNVAAGEYRFRTSFDLSGYAHNSARVQLNLAGDNRVTRVRLNGSDAGISYVGFTGFSPDYILTSGFQQGANTLEFFLVNDTSSPNPAGFRALLRGTARAQMQRQTQISPLPVTTYFRRAFQLSNLPHSSTLKLRALLDDGAIFYLNGVEVLRVNMPSGAVTSATPASSARLINDEFTISGSSLVAGRNVLAVEVHQAPGDAQNTLFAAELSVSPAVAELPKVAINEVAPAGPGFFLELANHGQESAILDGCVLELSGSASRQYIFPAGTFIPPGGLLQIDEVSLGFYPQRDDRLFLFSAHKNAVVDAVTVKATVRGRRPDGIGRWLRPVRATPGSANEFSLQHDIVINEIMFHRPDQAGSETREQWIELHNRGTNTVNLEGWQLDRGIEFQFPAGTIMAPGAFLVVAGDRDSLKAIYPDAPILGNFEKNLSRSSDLIVLLDANGNPADEVRYYDDRPWPSYADGGGSSLELRNPFSDNSRAEAWAASDETKKTGWKTYSYQAAASVSIIGPTQWSEFILGLLDAGEVLLDDISVIEVSSQRQLIQNGSFDTSAATWRIIGNHHGAVVPDPDNPANKVLHLKATGPTEHMHNHAETTLAGGARVTNGREYQISFRARWLAGANQLHTRLYFNRSARATVLEMPQKFGTPGARNSRYESNIGPTFDGLSHEPVLPAPNQPVTVAVSADDPENIAQCLLRWSSNGGAWMSAPMSRGGDGKYRGSIPGTASGATQFYVEGTDGLGATSTFPAEGRNARALFSVRDGQSTAGKLHSIRLIMTASDAARLHASTNVMSNDQMRGTMIYDENEVFYDIGVRLQGSQRGRDSSSRVGFTLGFRRDQLFRGVHDSITVDRSGGYSGRGGDHDEIVLKHAINHAGEMPGMYDDLVRFVAPRSEHTGTGLLLMAKYGDLFLESQYENGGDGKQFKLELIYSPLTTLGGGAQNPKLPQPDDVIGTDFRNLGDDKEAYRWNFLIENHRAEDDYSPVMRLAKTLGLSGAQLEAQANEVMDVDEWMRVFAMKALSGDVDSYNFGYPHNFVVYFRPGDGKALACIWDADFSWTASPTDAPYGTANISRLINRPNNRRQLFAHLNDIISTTFNPAYMAPWTTHYGSLVGQNYGGVLSFIEQRGNYIRSLFPAPVPFSIGTNAGQTLMVNTNSISFLGTGWLDVRRIEIEGQPGALNVEWFVPTSWRATVPLTLGANSLKFLAYNFSGQLIGSNIVHVTSTVAGAGLDTDNDGMPDSWEWANGLNSSVKDDSNDSDFDGFSNFQEYLAGTHPLERESVLRLRAAESNGTVQLSFQAAAGRKYRLEQSHGLGAASWQTLTNIPASINDRTAEIPAADSSAASSLFFRVVLLAP